MNFLEKDAHRTMHFKTTGNLQTKIIIGQDFQTTLGFNF